jgi:hypothetical protein
MPIYKVEVEEIRHVQCSYYVDVQIEVGDEYREARRLAGKGETVHEKEHCYTVEDSRAIVEEPKLHDMTPLEYLEHQAEGMDDDDDLSDVVHDILAEKASGINNGGLTEQLQFLLDEVGEEEAVKIINSTKSQAEKDRLDILPDQKSEDDVEGEPLG